MTIPIGMYLSILSEIVFNISLVMFPCPIPNSITFIFLLMSIFEHISETVSGFVSIMAPTVKRFFVKERAVLSVFFK